MKSLKIYVFIASVLLIFYLVAQYNKPKPTDWSATLRNADKIPFGTYILYHQLNDIFQGAVIQPTRQNAYTVANDTHGNKNTYLIVCNGAELSTYSYKKLIQFVTKGNEVFIAADYFGQTLQKELKIETNSELNLKNTIKISFLRKGLQTNQFALDRNCSNTFFSAFDTTRAGVEGINEFKHSNYLKFKIGKGALYLNSNPLMFSNYSLLHPQGAAYAAAALSCLNNKDYILWDEFYTRKNDENESPMRVFLSNAALRYAYYTAFFSLLLFVLYDIKRRQRIIPVITPLGNSTVEFINIVGQLYYEEHNNTDIAQKKLAYWLEQVRTRYNVKPTETDTDFSQTLSQKSGADPALISKIMQYAPQLQPNAQTSDDELIRLNQLIEQFYAQSR